MHLSHHLIIREVDKLCVVRKDGQDVLEADNFTSGKLLGILHTFCQVIFALAFCHIIKFVLHRTF